MSDDAADRATAAAPSPGHERALRGEPARMALSGRGRGEPSVDAVIDRVRAVHGV